METQEQRWARQDAELKAEKQQREDYLLSEEWRLSLDEMAAMVETLREMGRRVSDSHHHADWQRARMKPDLSHCTKCGHDMPFRRTEEQREQEAERDAHVKRLDAVESGIVGALSELEKELKNCLPCSRCRHRFRAADLSHFAGEWPWVDRAESLDEYANLEHLDEYHWCSGCLVEVLKALPEEQRQYTAEYEAQEKARAENPNARPSHTKEGG